MPENVNMVVFVAFIIAFETELYVFTSATIQSGIQVLLTPCNISAKNIDQKWLYK